MKKAERWAWAQRTASCLAVLKDKSSGRVAEGYMEQHVAYPSVTGHNGELRVGDHLRGAM